MLGEGALTFREFAMSEPLPLASIHDAVLEFLQGRKDVVLSGAQAVNASVAEPRMTQDVDIASDRGAAFAEELRQHLADRFRIAVRVQEVRAGLGYRIYPVRRDGNRHLVDVRPVSRLPASQLINEIQVVTPDALIAGKLLASVNRHGKPKAFTDQRDLAVLLLRFPELKAEHGLVTERLVEAGAGPEALAAWSEMVARELVADEEDEPW